MFPILLILAILPIHPIHSFHLLYFNIFSACYNQVLDGQYHMFVLEGLAEKGIARLWDTLPRPLEEGMTLGVVEWSTQYSMLCLAFKSIVVVKPAHKFQYAKSAVQSSLSKTVHVLNFAGIQVQANSSFHE